MVFQIPQEEAIRVFMNGTCLAPTPPRWSKCSLRKAQGAFLVVQWLRLHAPNAGGRGLIPSQGTGSHMPQLRVCMLQLKIPQAASKALVQINKCKKKKNTRSAWVIPYFNKRSTVSSLPSFLCSQPSPSLRVWVWSVSDVLVAFRSF